MFDTRRGVSIVVALREVSKKMAICTLR